jgi:hypothetical protein
MAPLRGAVAHFAITINQGTNKAAERWRPAVAIS